MSSGELSEKTIELLRECKKVGYGTVTVLVRDEKVPVSVKIKRGVWFGDLPH